MFLPGNFQVELLITCFMLAMVLLKYTKMQNIFWEFCQNCRRRFLGTSANIYGCGSQDTECQNRGKTFTVAVEGNIGSGKSTLLEYFRGCPIVETLQEPVSRWTNIRGHNALKLLYEDPSRWSFMFNNYVMLSRLEMHSYQHIAPVKLMERSLHSTRHIFVENSFQSGSLTGLEYHILQAWFDNLLAQPCTHVDLFVYLRVPPETCFERIEKRNRKEEKSLSLEFLRKLHNLHEEWLIKHKHGTFPVLVIDGSPDIISMPTVFEENRSKILCGCV